MSGTNPLAQSDDDFLNEQPPVVDPSEARPSAEEEAAAAAAHNNDDPPADDGTGGDDGKSADGSNADDDDTNKGGDDDGENADDKDDKSDKGEDDGDADKKTGQEDKPAAGADGDAAKPKGKDGQADGGNADAGKTFNVPTSFQANGKTIELKDEGEALKLMQMGANYTRKLQELAPHRKTLMMLQNNDLMDESKLSFLIDLDKKNPEAIKKLIKDAGIDIQDLDMDGEIDYQAGNHAVTDQEVGFRTVMEEVASTPAGKETIALVNQDLDQASKEALWQQPELLTILHEQREAGIYDRIKAEVDRRRTLGTIAASTPFFAAYKQVGDELMAAASGDAPAGQQPNGKTEGSQELATPAPTPVTTRAAAPKADVKNGDKAGAASPTRAAPGSAKVTVNPLALSDEDFLKSMDGRV